MELVEALQELGPLVGDRVTQKRREQAAGIVFEALAEIAQKRLKGRCAEEREDLCQEAILRCIKARRGTFLRQGLQPDEEPLRATKRVKAYLNTMLQNVCKDLLRREKQTASLEESQLASTDEEEAGERRALRLQMKETERLLEELVEQVAQQKRQDAAQRLREDVQQMIALKKEETTIDELCAQTKQNNVALYQRHCRARRDLLQALPSFCQGRSADEGRWLEGYLRFLQRRK